MSKQNIYISQFNNSTERNLMPLSAGLLSSNAYSKPRIKETFNIQIEILRDEPEKIVQNYVEPVLLAYSNYFWNYHYTLEVARQAKEKFPDALILFGGPSVPTTEDRTKEFLEENPYIDILVVGEGEIIFSEILLAIANNEPIHEIENITTNFNGNVIFNSKRDPIKDFDHLPSPFLDGTFDTLLKKHPEAITGVVWESNRGCPYSCSFCYWGGPEKRITAFSEERFYKELNWISDNKINYIFGADANFGILPRDKEIAKHIAHLNNTTGYPKFLVINWNKNSTDKIFDIVDELNKSTVSFMLTVSVQSFHMPTLEAVQRKNIKVKHFNNILAQADKRNFNTYTEIILCLPLETYETFKNGLRNILVDNLNYHFNLYPCVMITGTAMNDPEYITKYDIQTRRCEINLAKAKTKKDKFKEYEDIIVGTSTMNNQQWQKSYKFGFFIKALYGFRLVFYVFNYIRDNTEVDLIDLFEYIIDKHDPVKYKTIHKCIKVLEDISTSILNNGQETIKLDNIDTSLYPEMALLITVLNDKKAFYSDLEGILSEYLSLEKAFIDKKSLSELILYQDLHIPSFTGKEIETMSIESKKIKRYFNINSSEISFKDDLFTNNIDDFLASHIYGGMIFTLNKIIEKDLILVD